MSKNDLIYMIFCGTSPYPIINSLWASIDIKGIKPTEIVLLVSEKQRGLEKIKKCVETLIENTLGNNCSVENLIISEWDIKKNIDQLSEFLNKMGEPKKELIVDITPGRKTMSISGVLFVNNAIGRKIATKEIFQHIIYWHLIESDKYSSKWYPEIPRENFNFVDLMEVIK